ncbi:acyl-CoA-binding domain-containing protein 4 isoform 2-T2 [Discoglossus pictus]
MGTDQDQNGPQRQFNAAVTVIQSLPKSDSYRPSHEEMLRFYSYYKQAVVGPCNIARPGFWDPIGRYKWDAWNRLGRMSQEDAMTAYVREMKKVAQKILDTVSLEDTSPEMFEPFRPLYEVIPDMPRPPDSFFKILHERGSPREELEEQEETTEELDTRTESRREGLDTRTERPENRREGLDTRTERPESRRREELDTWTTPGHEAHINPVGQAQEDGKRVQPWVSESDDFCDTLEQLEPNKDSDGAENWIHPHLFQPSPDVTSSEESHGGDVPRRQCCIDTVVQSESDPGHAHSTCSSDVSGAPYQLSPQIMATVRAIEASIQGLCRRIESLERMLQEQALSEHLMTPRRRPKPRFSIPGPPRTLFLILVWPFFVHWIMHRYYRRKR